jgi:hypothetical protein
MEAVQSEAKQKKQRQTKGQPGLREVANTPERVKAFGKEYEVRRFTLRDVAEAVQYLGPLSYVLRYMDAFQKDAEGRPVIARGDMIELAIRAVSLSGDSAIGMLSVITKEPVDWLEQQDPMDGLELLVMGVEKNLDFFSEKNIARAKALFGRLGAVLPQRGGTPSENSSSAGTEQKTTS